MIELFEARMEVTNPGLPLVDPLRFIDEPSHFRNEALAGLMRRMNMYEERGRGIKKVIAAVEEYQLPAPDFRTAPQHTIAVLYVPRAFADMNRRERNGARQHRLPRIDSCGPHRSPPLAQIWAETLSGNRRLPSVSHTKFEGGSSWVSRHTSHGL